MLTSDFDYKLPPNLIAQKPLPRRDQSRMMVLDRKTNKIIHSYFHEFPLYLNEEDVLILNTTKVIPARVWGRQKGKEIEFLFLKESQKNTWQVLCRPAMKVKKGDTIFFSRRFQGEVIRVEPEGKRVIRFASQDVLKELKRIGSAPLPPYIKRRKNNVEQRELDLERYQTVFAQEEGAIAAPTAGLHFSPRTLKKIVARGVQVTSIRLDVGLATFQPVRAKRLKDHQMLEETYFISSKAAQSINEAKTQECPVVAVGTTSVRALESAFKGGKIRPGEDSSDLFIYPGYRFKVVDKLLTNFHLPKSTLLMLISAFAGFDFTRKAYEEAVQEKYRFYSYGDCMLIL